MRVALALLLLAGTARAQVDCMPRDKMLAMLSQEYGERPIGAGPHLDGQSFVEVFVSEQRTFSVVVSRASPQGLMVSCIIAAGENWEALKAPVPGERSS